MPSEYTSPVLQDIDVAYATDPSIFDDFDADLSSLLEVPDLDFPSSQDFPQASYRDSAFASSSAHGGMLLPALVTPLTILYFLLLLLPLLLLQR